MTPGAHEVAAAFGAAAESYDRERRRIIPCFDLFYGAAVDAIALDPASPVRVLDLGAGTGILADSVLRRFPAARIDLMDASEQMLERARERFRNASCVRVRAGDYVRHPLGGPYDAVVSALSIHHLADADKRAVYARAVAALAPCGWLVNADNVLAEDPAVAARDRELWIARVRESGIVEPVLAAAIERTKLDRLAPLATQLGWLRALGCAEVHCPFQWRHFAVMAGRRLR